MLSWATLVSRNIQADLHIVAWSGKGVVRNYGDASQMSEYPMPTYYNRTLGSRSLSATNYWNPAGSVVGSYVPTMILVHLGTNDFSTQPAPSDSQFTTGLIDFVHVLQADYPNAKIGLICSPKMASSNCVYISNAAVATNTTYAYIPSDAMVKPDGCDGHPSIAAQESIAAYVMPAVESMLNN